MDGWDPHSAMVYPGWISLIIFLRPVGQNLGRDRSPTPSACSGASSYGFTNEYQSQGKIYLRARHYMPSIGRFLTRDTWGGNANSPMSFNRWNYTGGNPVNRIDPSGLSWISDLYGLNFLGGWANVDRKAAETAAIIIGYRFTQTLNPNYGDDGPIDEGSIYKEARVFRAVYGIKENRLFKLDFQGLLCSECRSQACQDAKIWEDITYVDKDGKNKYKNIPGTDIPCACKPRGGVTYTEHEIRIASLWPNYNTHGDYWKYIRKINNMIHEFGHAFNQRANGAPRIAVSSYSETVMVKGKPVDFVMNKRPLGFYTDTHGSMTWVQSSDDATTGEASPGSEVFADMFLGWTWQKWASDPYGDARSRFMDNHMLNWINTAIAKP